MNVKIKLLNKGESSSKNKLRLYIPRSRNIVTKQQLKQDKSLVIILGEVGPLQVGGVSKKKISEKIFRGVSNFLNFI